MSAYLESTQTADLISNTPSIRNKGPGFWSVYQAEASSNSTQSTSRGHRHTVLHNRLAHPQVNNSRRESGHVDYTTQFATNLAETILRHPRRR